MCKAFIVAFSFLIFENAYGIYLPPRIKDLLEANLEKKLTKGPMVMTKLSLPEIIEEDENPADIQTLPPAIRKLIASGSKIENDQTLTKLPELMKEDIKHKRTFSSLEDLNELEALEPPKPPDYKALPLDALPTIPKIPEVSKIQTETTFHCMTASLKYFLKAE